MTIYNGEYIRVGVTADLQIRPNVFVPLTDVDVVSAEITIWDGDGNEVLDDSLNWEPDHGIWFNDWDTTGHDPGRYRVRCLFNGPGDHRSWEYGTIRLTADRAPVVVAP